jgi:hypothetical protein
LLFIFEDNYFERIQVGSQYNFHLRLTFAKDVKNFFMWVSAICTSENCPISFSFIFVLFVHLH